MKVPKIYGVLPVLEGPIVAYIKSLEQLVKQAKHEGWSNLHIKDTTYGWFIYGDREETSEEKQTRIQRVKDKEE